MFTFQEDNIKFCEILKFNLLLIPMSSENFGSKQAFYNIMFLAGIKAEHYRF